MVQPRGRSEKMPITIGSVQFEIEQARPMKHRSPASTRRALSALFVANGFAFGVWSAHIAGTLCFGLLRGTVDVSTNTQAIITERAYGSAVMSGLQGFWSLGGVIGAAFSSVLLRQHSTARQNLFAAAVCMPA